MPIKFKKQNGFGPFHLTMMGLRSGKHETDVMENKHAQLKGVLYVEMCPFRLYFISCLKYFSTIWISIACYKSELGFIIKFMMFVPVVLQVSFFSSLWNHPFFTISCVTLIALFFAGIHKRVVAPSMYPLSIAADMKQQVGMFCRH